VLAEQDLAYIELVTVTSNPHLLVADYVTVPSGHTLVSLAENLNERSCSPGATKCKQRWDVWLDTSEVCDLDGAYELGLTVECAPGADCSAQDPSFVELTVPFILDSRSSLARMLAPATAPETRQRRPKSSGHSLVHDTFAKPNGRARRHPSGVHADLRAR